MQQGGETEYHKQANDGKKVTKNSAFTQFETKIGFKKNRTHPRN